jgi:hypothetical protein
MPQVLHKPRREKKKRVSARPGLNPQVVVEPPSLAGALSLFLGLLGLLSALAQLMIQFQASVTAGAAGVESKFLSYLSKAQLLPGVIGLVLAVGCLCLSSRRRSNGVWGLVLCLAVLATWLLLGNLQVKW